MKKLLLFFLIIGCSLPAIGQELLVKRFDANYNEVELNSWTDDGYLVIKKSDIETGARYF